MNLTRWELSAAGLAIFIAWGFLTHWLPLIRFLGYAFVAGSILTTLAFLAISLLSVASPQNDRKNDSWPRAGLAKPNQWKQETAWLQESTRYKRKTILPQSLTVSESLDELLDWVLRDFVASWYGNISSSPRFINEIDSILRDVMIEFRGRLESVDIVEIAVLQFVPIITAHMKDFYEAEQSVRGKKLNRNVTESEELDLAIAAKYRDGRLHPAASLAFADTATTQTEHLRKIVARLLPVLVPVEIIQSKAVSVLVQEIVACAVLATIVRTLAEPDTWNQVLEGYGRTMLQDRKTVRKLRAALDEHATVPSNPKQQAFPRLAPDDDERKFERFIRAIRQCNNLSDARRFRNEVSSQLTREAMKEGQNPTYIKRLGTGKRVLDQRIGMLSAVGGAPKLPSSSAHPAARSAKANASAVDIMKDTAGLSYFMEYMDRQHLVSLLQFWLVVDGFRDPLENDQHESSHVPTPARPWTESERLDIAQISDAYLSRPELKVSSGSRQSVKDFLKAGRHATNNQYLKSRAVILQAQKAVQEELQEQHLPGFRRSDLFYKYLTSEDTSNKAPSAVKPRPQRPIHASSDALLKKVHLPIVPIQRVNSATAELKRSPKSAMDLKSSLLGIEATQAKPRRSLDHDASAPLFDDDVEPENAEPVRRSLDIDSMNENATNGDQQDAVEAVEAALNDIMVDGSGDVDLVASQPDLRDLQHDAVSKSLRNGPLEFGHHNPEAEQPKEKPNLASLGLVNTSSRIGVFKDNDLFGDEGKFLEDEKANSEGIPSDKEQEEDEIHEAEPGDLGLAEAISSLTMDIDKLVSQEAIVDTLTRKAELTNNVAELRILGKSKSSLQREIRRKELQRQQYMVQESDNSLFGRATIHINSSMVGKDDDGQEFALYLISVNRQAGEHLTAATWTVARRYSEFHKLHQRLRALYPTVRNLEFPRRRLVMKLQNDFLQKRRVSLEHYLSELLRLPAVCRSRDLRAFLSQRPILTKDEIQSDSDRADIVSRIYNSVTDGMDEFLGNIPVLDQLSLAGQNLISAATSQYYANSTTTTSTIAEVGGIDVREARTELEAFDNQTLEPLVKPISEIFLEIFELNRSPNWLRGKAVVVVLHQLLGGTVERKVRETAKALFSDDNLLKYLALARDIMWPGGVLQKEKKQRTEAEKRTTRKEASVVLAALIPELAGSIVGRANAQAASRRLFATLNNSRLNTHLIFRLLDEMIVVLFPDAEKPK